EHATHHPFAARQASVLAASPDIVRIDTRQPAWPTLPTLPETGAPFQVAATAEQTALIDRLLKFALGRRRRPLVITADRGRGKSAALGIAAAKSLQAGRGTVMVTAPVPENVETLFQHARATLDADLAEDHEHELIASNGGRLGYLPIAELLSARPEAEVVLVDEAAALPPQMLREVLLGWPRVAFASTVHGYEGSGRGFDLRFRNVLDSETPQWRAQRLEQPIRWCRHDPLEAIVCRLFLLDAEAPASGSERITLDDVMIEPWNPAQVSDAELEAAFGLLVNAHYRTRPSDLRQWLDDPAARSWRATCNGVTVGVLWCSEEGGLPESLALDVTQGRRRLRGHLLAQSLANHGGFPEAASQRLLRVVRIAVAEPARRLGIGKQLVAAARDWARAEGLDSLGTSFGGEPGLLAFWQSCGLALVRLGLNREASTGEYPVQMLCGQSEAGRALAQGLRRRLSQHWPVMTPLHWSDMPVPLLLALRADLPTVIQLDVDDRRDLTNFADGHRGFELTLPVLRSLEACPGMARALAEHPDAGVWARAVSQGWSWPAIQQAGLCQGRAECENRLRALVRELLAGALEL
ncbi:MAG: tRNA cytosine(34) acetyltransferase TmcA, partial [Marinobacter sp. 34-60-7]